MLWVDITGISGSAAIAISFFPQTFSSLKKRSVEGLSIRFILLILFASISMDIYAFYYLIIPMIIANVCVTVNSLILVNLYIYEHKLLCYTSKQDDDVPFDLEFT